MLWSHSRHHRPLLALVAVAAGSLFLAACSSSSSGSKTTAPKGSASSASNITTSWNLKPAASIEKLVPAQFKSSGISNGVYNDYPPEEFLAGSTLVGIQPDIVLALSEVMGTKIRNVSVGS